MSVQPFASDSFPTLPPEVSVEDQLRHVVDGTTLAQRVRGLGSLILEASLNDVTRIAEHVLPQDIEDRRDWFDDVS